MRMPIRRERAVAGAVAVATITMVLLRVAGSGPAAAVAIAGMTGLASFLVVLGGRGRYYGAALFLIVILGGLGVYADSQAESACDWDSREPACGTSISLLMMAAVVAAGFLGLGVAAVFLLASERLQKSADEWLDAATRRAVAGEGVPSSSAEVEGIARELASEAAGDGQERAWRWRKRLSALLVSEPGTVGQEIERLEHALRLLPRQACQAVAATVAEVKQEYSDRERDSLEQLVPGALLESLSGEKRDHGQGEAVISIYFRLMGWVEILSGLVTIAWPSEMEVGSDLLATVLGVSLLVAGIGTFVVAAGMDSLELWAWYAGVIMTGLAVSSAAAAAASGQGLAVILLVINVAAAWYLLSPGARAAFGVFWRPGKAPRSGRLRVTGKPGTTG